MMIPDKIPSLSTKRMSAGQLRVMQVASYCCTFFFDLLFTQSRNFYHLAWMLSDSLKKTNSVERRVNRTNRNNQHHCF